MQTEVVSLDVIQVASPCTASWEEMVGDDRVRFCGQCRLNVYNLSEMTRADATRFMQNREGRTCIRFYRRADGTVLTRDCPVGLRAVRRRVARMAAAIVAVCGAMMAGTLFAWSGSMNGRRTTNASSAVSSPKTTFSCRLHSRWPKAGPPGAHLASACRGCSRRSTACRPR